MAQHKEEFELGIIRSLICAVAIISRGHRPWLWFMHRISSWLSCAAGSDILVNFGGWSGWKSLGELNLSDGVYHELWNSTWPAFTVEGEGEHTNGGRNARLNRGSWLQVPDYGAVVLERI